MSTAVPAGGRRSAVSRSLFSPTLVLGLVLVLLTGGALLLVQPHQPDERTAAPTSAALDSASVGCPSGPSGSAVAVGTGQEGAEGEARVRTGDSARVRLVSGRVTTVDESGPVVVTGEGDVAPDLLAARSGGLRVAAADCPAPTPEVWFAGVGATATHDGVLELVNPDAGPAVADVTVYARRGIRPVPRLLGLTVRGRDTLRIRLGEVSPRRSELALRVVVSRGRLATSLLDQRPALGSSPASEDWLPSQAEPTTDALHLGVVPGPGEDVLSVANPGDDEARVSLSFLTADSEFTPEGVEELRVPPGSVQTVDLSSALRSAVGDGAIGLRVTSDVPVLSSTRTVVREDLSHTEPVDAVDRPVTALLPEGAARLVLADAGGVGTATVQPFTASGRALEESRVELKPGQGAEIELPRGTALVRVLPRRTSVHGAVVVTGRGATVVALRERITEALLPDVRPGLP